MGQNNNNKVPNFTFRKKQDSDEGTENIISSELLRPYILNGQSEQLMEQLEGQVFVLGDLVLQGQSTIIFSQPGVGKTVIALKLLCVAIKQGSINANKVYYINADDNFRGVAEKLQVAEEVGFYMLVPGHKGFKVSSFIKLLSKLCDEPCHGIIIILDTIKKFTDPMQKGQAREFWGLVRRFVAKGGTVLALAHANKHLDSTGRPIYAGTSDSVDDVDCAYTIRLLEAHSKEPIKLVQFENIKNRGDVSLQATYQYSTEKGLTYQELLDSVEQVDDETANTLQDGDLQQQVSIVDAITNSINIGVNQKMALIDAVSRSTGTSKRSVQKIIERFTGDNRSRHKWNFNREHRGAQVFYILGDDDDLY